ncbi:MAG TPA: sialate O-acetylesterase [Chthoniobacteraceae bacterium]|jgi:sialate O-acetylesterase|nr:sialate O-acetylesterase [Chthoniobacteraceae bacterium]
MKALLLLVVLAFAGSVHAELRLAPLFRDYAVLQQGKPIPVWGRAAPNEKVSVSFHGNITATTADEHGNWRADLPAERATADAAELTVKGEQTITLRDVVVGEVWLCSGQSNMEWRLDQAAQAEQEIAGADFPLIRQFRLPKVAAEAPPAEADGKWIAASPKTAGSFSAVAYFFARDLHRELKVPIGLINASWGGKMIEVFLSAEALAGDPAFSAVEKRWQEELARLPAQLAAYEKAATPQTMSPAAVVAQHRPSCVFNGLIAPVIPYALRGAIWYQGEHNISRPGEYRALFSAMITDWRRKFGQGDFPFYFAQLSSFSAPLDKSREGFALLREAQADTLALPATGMAVTVDIGTPDNVHPRNKQEVGARLARLARAQTYNLGGEWSGPVLKEAAGDKNAVRLTFRHPAKGLVLKETSPPAFEIAGADGKFQPAAARIDGDAVVLQAETVPAPVRVRYAWGNAPPAALFNSEGLPASPFRCTVP